MLKITEDMSLKDLMDRLDEIKFERLRKEAVQRKEQRARHQVLSVEEMAEYLGVAANDLKIRQAKGNPTPVYFRKLDLRI